MALGRNWAADKAVEGDEATPARRVLHLRKNPRSKFFLSMCLSYPNAEDAERGLAAGLITPAEHAAILEAMRRRACRRSTRGWAGRSTSTARIPVPPAPAGAAG